MEHKSYYAIIPANVRYDKELTPNAKLLYGEITALCNEKGYCWASNDYFAKLYDVSTVSISKWVNQLVDKGYINSVMNYKEGSKEILNRYLTLVNDPIKEKFNTPQRKVKDPIKEKFKDNNTFNNTYNNTNNIMSSKHDSIPYLEIIDYLNRQTNSKFKHTTQATKTLIKARFNEGFKLDDFKQVIDNKCGQWLYDSKMKQYLRPQTLFGTKFEAYLNEQTNNYQFEDSTKREEKEPTPEEIAEFEKAREQFDKYKRTYTQNQS